MQKMISLLPLGLALSLGVARAAGSAAGSDANPTAPTPAGTAATAAPTASTTTAPASVTSVPKAGAEDKKLAAFMKSSTWSGKIAAGAFGPDSKEIASHGRSTCREMFGGLAFNCEVQDTMGTGKSAFTWKGNMMAGFDRLTRTYKCVMVDSNGTVTSWTGSFPTDDGKKFVLLSDAELQMGPGPAFKDQLTWDMSGAKETYSDDHLVSGQSSNFETAEMKPATSAKK